MNRVFDILSRLASLLYQRKYIICGTIDEYVLPDQLLDEAIAYINTMLSNPRLSECFQEKQLKELIDLVQNLELLFGQIPFEDESVSNEELVLSNQCWIDARNLAAEFLNKRGYDLKAWEKDNCS